MRPARPPFTKLLAALPAAVPFLSPDVLERRSGRTFQLRLGANESSFGSSPRAVEAMHSAAQRAVYYGDPESYELRAALAHAHGIAMDNLLVGSGIDDLLGLVVRAFLAPGDTAVTSLGAYPTFNYHVAGYGGQLHRVPYRHFRNDLAALAETAERVGARIVYLANPDNPTGTHHPPADVLAFLEQLPADCLLILDEAYADFLPAAELPLLAAEHPRVIRMRTFSKAHGLAGLRIGYAIAARETIAAFDKIRLHFGVNLMAQAAALASLQDKGFVQHVVRQVEAGREAFAQLAAELGFHMLPSATNFVAIDVGSAERAQAILAALAERDVFIRMPGAAPLDRCIRVTVGTAVENARFAERLRELLAEGLQGRVATPQRS